METGSECVWQMEAERAEEGKKRRERTGTGESHINSRAHAAQDPKPGTGSAVETSALVWSEQSNRRGVRGCWWRRFWANFL